MLLSSALASSWLATCDGTPTHWDLQPSVWQLGTDGGTSASSTLTNDEILAVQSAAWEVWSASGDGACNGWLSAQGPTTTAGFDLYDSENTVSFAEDVWDPMFGDPQLTLAITASAYNPVHCGILGADLLYNAVGFEFSTSDTLVPGAVDLPSVATHENGHWLGLGHSEIPEATMYPTYAADLAHRDLADDDLDAVTDLYPGNCEGEQEICRNGLDDDGDGLTDCADPTCSRDARCTCPAELPLACGDSIEGSTRGRLATVDHYEGRERLLEGPEAVHQLEIPAGAGDVVELSLRTWGGDLELLVSPLGWGDVCVPDLVTQQTHRDRLAMRVQPGERYAVVVDGTSPHGADYALTVRCPGLGAPTTPVPETSATPPSIVPATEPVPLACTTSTGPSLWGLLVPTLALLRRRRQEPTDQLRSASTGSSRAARRAGR